MTSPPPPGGVSSHTHTHSPPYTQRGQESTSDNSNRSGGCKCLRHLKSSKTKLLLYRGSFLLVVIIILVAGGVSSHFKLSFADGNSTNATTSCSEVSVPSTPLFSAGLPGNEDLAVASPSHPSSPLPPSLPHR